MEINEFQYDIGDKVFVEPSISATTQGYIVYVVPEMEQCAGKMVTISERYIRGDGYPGYCVEECPGWTWSEDMFLSVDYMAYTEEQKELVTEDLQVLYGGIY